MLYIYIYIIFVYSFRKKGYNVETTTEETQSVSSKKKK